MSSEFWYGTLLSIPIGLATGVAGGLLQRPVQNWLDLRGASREERRLELLRRDYHQTLFFGANPDEFKDWLLNCIVRSILGTAFIVLGSTMAVIVLVAAFNFGAPFGVPEIVILFVSSVIGMAMHWRGSYHLSWGRSALTVARKVRLFQVWTDTLPYGIRDREAEAKVIATRHVWYDPVREDLGWPKEKGSAAGE